MKIKVRLRRKWPLENIFFFIAMFCVTTYALLEHVSIPIPAYSTVKFPLLYLGGICILSQLGHLFRVLLKRKYFYVMLVMTAFCLVAFLSAYFNKNPSIGVNPMNYTLRLVLYIVELFLVMIWAAETGRSRMVLGFVFYYLLIVTLASDVLMFTNLITFEAGGYINYLVGTKFIVVYFHFNLLAIWLVRSKERLLGDRKVKLIAVVGIAVVVFISFYVDCMSGILGCLMLVLMLGFLRSPRRNRIVKLESPVLMQTVVAATVIFPFIAGAIVSLPAVRHILTNMLNRSETLTGRMNIYTEFVDAMRKHWLWGYGAGNANTVSIRMFGYANAQNGVLQWILQIGVPGTVLLVALMSVVFSRLHKSSVLEKSIPLVCLIYMYIVLGMIEITYSMSFLLWFALVFMLSAENSAGVTDKPTANGA